MIVGGSKIYWLGGVVVSAVGVLMVRVVPAWSTGEPPVLLRTAGFVLAFAGLLVILFGLRRKGNRVR